jgi:hypothetical protein
MTAFEKAKGVITIHASDERENVRKELKQAFPENHHIVSGLCESLKNANDYRIRILEQIKKQLGITSMRKVRW